MSRALSLMDQTCFAMGFNLPAFHSGQVNTKLPSYQVTKVATKGTPFGANERLKIYMCLCVRGQCDPTSHQ